MALPEHAPRIPHIPVPDLKGGARWLGNHWPALTGAVLTAASAGLTYQLFFNPDRGSSAPISDNAPVSDTFKPSPEQPGIVVNPEPITPNLGEVPTSSGPTPPQPETPLINPSTPERVLGTCNFFKNQDICTTGQRIIWPNNGRQFSMAAFIVPAGEIINLPQDMQVASSEINDIDTKGRLLIGKNAENTQTIQVLGSIESTDEDLRNKKTKDLPAGSLATVTSTNGVFKNYPYNVVISGPEDVMNQNLSVVWKQTPELIQRDGGAQSTSATSSARWFSLPLP